ncbi:class I SAM-dependent methyltransferase [Mycolicibacterium rufum]|uniref:S-adenosyl-L-methionine-dependent methyltransferase n=1 Tax=Mycolicibacterium rufum TaxID=318424 RepID=A0A9X3BQU1_9MYCO|nr:class I SAM-dependent methyltransferase [Mycolicibacterium rufum]KGI67851.1 methyltransferase [Mycolicibacterium rufum]MCV7070661.1 class I SAM-dependent methyltransferase [Mycolicibacterium rufum]ULP38836.1 class I SAM-dependent methyltransferase [Mycolicibacterium rufum]
MTGRSAAAKTAVGPMVVAAVEHLEPAHRRLVDDDLAVSFLPGPLRALVALSRNEAVRRALVAGSERQGPGLWTSIACRKRLIDERLSDPLTEVDAVVVLGAGLDTRGCRIARHSDLPVFEVDLPVNVARKAAVLQRALGGIPASVHLVPVDVEHDDLMTALRSAGYDSAARTFFIAEGLLQYLQPQTVTALLSQLSGAPGSRLVFTYIRQDFLDGSDTYGAEAVYRRFRGRQPVWRSGLVPEDLGEWLAELGWRLDEQAGPSYFRDLYIRPTGRALTASPIEWTALAHR